MYLFLLLLGVSCKEIVDTELPIAVIDDPTENEAVFTDNDLRIVATLTDNTGLLQYKLTIDGIDSLNGIAADSTLSMIFVDAIPNEEKAFYLDQTIELDDNTFNGNFQMVLSSLDVEGNESIKDTVRFEIVNSLDPDPPVFNVTGPTSGDTLEIGSGFLVLGNVSDAQHLNYSEIFIGPTDFSDTIRFTTFPWITNNMVNYDDFTWWHQVDSTWSQGSYHVYYTAWDNVSGTSHTIPFYVSY
jgi:hypothetical protein